jgi:hypothetical protein
MIATTDEDGMKPLIRCAFGTPGLVVAISMLLTETASLEFQNRPWGGKIYALIRPLILRWASNASERVGLGTSRALLLKRGLVAVREEAPPLIQKLPATNFQSSYPVGQIVGSSVLFPMRFVLSSDVAIL